MGLTTALYTGLSGLNANSSLLSVAGNNISNVNTTAFKRSRVNFQTQISQTLASGSAPTAQHGGTNPTQVGLGVQVGGIRREFSGGAIQPTGVSTDVAIEGNGFFVVNDNGNTRYTRDGNFGLDRNFNLVTTGGALVQGYASDADYNIQEGTLSNISIPIGLRTLAEATETVNFAGNLNAGGDIGTQGAQINSEPLYSDAAATTAATGATALTSLYDADGNQLFANGEVITISGATKGGATLPDRTFQVGGMNITDSDDFGTTLGDFADFLNDVFGIDTTISGGVSVGAGFLIIEGNEGAANDLVLDTSSIILNQSTSPTSPLSMSKIQSSDGESVRTSFVGYDSLGNPLVLELTVVLEEKTDAGTSWRFYAQSADDTDLDRHMGTGTLTFNTTGRLTNVEGSTITIDRNDTGAGTPQSIELLFAEGDGTVTALADVNSQVSAIAQDGSALGSLEDFTISQDGTVTGIFTNGLLRPLGRLPVAMFVNNEGLEESGGNLYRATVNSGSANVVTGTTAGAGRIVGRALELSNVDLGEEFISLITASTGFSASSRVLTTSDQLMQELLSMVR